MSRLLKIKHATHYTYALPVQRSRHLLHIRPLQDEKQLVKEHNLSISRDCVLTNYDDVFGNPTSRVEIVGPYTDLRIESISIVELMDIDPFAFASVPINRTFPLAWMPWEKMMLAPYLQPSNCPTRNSKNSSTTPCRSSPTAKTTSWKHSSTST